MAYTNYGFGKAFAYKFPWQWAMEREDKKEYRDAMLSDRQQQRTDRQNRWMMEQMKVGLPTNEWDTKQYNNWLTTDALPRMNQFATQDPNFMYDPEKMLGFAQLKAELLNHPSIVNSQRVSDQLSAYTDDLNTGKLKENDPEAMQFMQNYNRYTTSGGDLPQYTRSEEYDFNKAISDNFGNIEWSEELGGTIQTMSIPGSERDVYAMIPGDQQLRDVAVSTYAENTEFYDDLYSMIGQNGLKERNPIDMLVRMGRNNIAQKTGIVPLDPSDGGGKPPDPMKNYNPYLVDVVYANKWGSDAAPNDNVKYLIPHHGTDRDSKIYFPSESPAWIQIGEDNWEQRKLPADYNYVITKGNHIIPGTDADQQANNRFASVEVSVEGVSTLVQNAATDIMKDIYGIKNISLQGENETSDNYMSRISEESEGRITFTNIGTKNITEGTNTYGMPQYSVSFIMAAPVYDQYSADYIANTEQGATQAKKFSHLGEEYYGPIRREQGDIPLNAVRKDPNVVVNTFAIEAKRLMTPGDNDIPSSVKTEYDAWIKKGNKPEEFFLQKQIKVGDQQFKPTRAWFNDQYIKFKRENPGYSFNDFVGSFMNEFYKDAYPTKNN